jgi:hypothetical protein
MNRFVLRSIAVAEIAGGFAAFVLECISLYFTLTVSGAHAAMSDLVPDAVFSLSLAALSFYAGLRLWRLQPSGLRWSSWIQALQIPFYSSAAFSYKAKLGVGFWLFCHPQTWFVGFTAALAEFSLGLWFGGDTETPSIAVNLLAVALVVYLMRTMAREQRAAQAGARLADEIRAQRAVPRPWPLRILRFAFKTIMVLLAMVLIPVFAWWIYNRIDEAPTQEAIRWFAPLPHGVADADNAWLYLMGLGAAADTDPIAFGRQRVDAYEARERERGMQPASAAEQALKKDPVPFQSADVDGNKLTFICDLEQPGCLRWARESAKNLEKLEQLNALRLARYRKLLQLQSFEEVSTPSEGNLNPDIGNDNALYRALILRDLNEPTRRGDAFERLAALSDFWRRVGAQAQGMVMKQIAARMLLGAARVVDGFVDEYGVGAIDAAHDSIATVLRASSVAQHDLELPLRRDALGFKRMLDKIMLGPIDTLRFCHPVNGVSCLKEWLIAQAYAPQATLNERASLFQGELERYRADARDYDAAGQRWGELMERHMFLGKAHESARALAYNMTGKTLAYISVGAAVWSGQLYDTDGVQRLVSAKLAALSQHIPPAALPNWLAALPDASSNPYGDGFHLDPALREIYFEPHSPRWNKPTLSVAYPEHANIDAYRVVACAHPLNVVLRATVKGAKEPAVRHLSTCGSGLKLGSDEGRDSAHDELAPGVELLNAYVGADADRVSLRVRTRDGDGEHLAEMRDATIDSKQLELKRAPKKGGPEFHATVERAPATRVITVQVEGSPPLQRLARDVAQAAGVEVVHVERLGDAHPNLQLVYDRIPVQELLSLIADLSGAKLALRDLGHGRYEYAPVQK